MCLRLLSVLTGFFATRSYSAWANFQTNSGHSFTNRSDDSQAKPYLS
ncbi:hypothetical protein DES37_10199 [Mangrovibacter plantisponsor]|uniref:Uncharacterized protein n=1 Tax=Mangrovibacter plantisponsor TaxID=451513 RepID=A0A317Q9B1_9ENTR|nr:hypothetical protein DES37_10199 [Mangrovibacter plantisponsor]